MKKINKKMNTLGLSIASFCIIIFGFGINISGLMNLENQISNDLQFNINTANPVIPPHLSIHNSISPPTIYIAGTENVSPLKSIVHLRVSGSGTNRAPIDIIFSIDCSMSMSWNDPNDIRLTATKKFIDRLNPAIDQVGVVGWNEKVILSRPLTNDFDYIKNEIDIVTLDWETYMNKGLNKGNTLLDNGGHPESTKVMIFLSDGRDTDADFGVIDAANYAASQGYVIHTVGLNASGDRPVDDVILTEIADITGGTFFVAQTAADLLPLFDVIVGHVIDQAATGIIVTQKLANNINYVNGSASKAPASFNSGILTWDLGDLLIGETWEVTYEIMGSKTGILSVTSYYESNVSYVSYTGTPETLVFPLLEVEVIKLLQIIPIIVIPLLLAVAALSTLGYVMKKRGSHHKTSMLSKVPYKSKVPVKSKFPVYSKHPVHSKQPVYSKHPVQSKKPVYSKNHTMRSRGSTNPYYSTTKNFQQRKKNPIHEYY